MEAAPELRRYYPIWKKLKQDGHVSVTSPRPLHPRIIKAVKKEKGLDTGFKVLLDGKVAVLSHARDGSIIHFFLTIKSNTLDLRSKKGGITTNDF